MNRSIAFTLALISGAILSGVTLDSRPAIAQDALNELEAQPLPGISTNEVEGIDSTSSDALADTVEERNNQEHYQFLFLPQDPNSVTQQPGYNQDNLDAAGETIQTPSAPASPVIIRPEAEYNTEPPNQIQLRVQ
ncbi:MAG: hypothetical protein Kow00121_55580 [Elainellaceae cyanobacterium]